MGGWLDCQLFSAYLDGVDVQVNTPEWTPVSPEAPFRLMSEHAATVLQVEQRRQIGHLTLILHAGRWFVVEAASDDA